MLIGISRPIIFIVPFIVELTSPLKSMPVLIHPRLESWTHHKPVLMLLGLAAIASILVPSHHRMEKWLKQRLMYSRKR